jgi:predicted Zn-dependent peptidase
MMIYFGTDQKYYERALEIVYKEPRRLRTERLSEPRLNVIKRQFTGQLTIARESNLGHMMALGKGLLMTNRHEPLEKILQDIQQTTSGDLLEISNEIFEPSNLGLLTFVPARGNTTKT